MTNQSSRAGPRLRLASRRVGRAEVQAAPAAAAARIGGFYAPLQSLQLSAEEPPVPGVGSPQVAEVSLEFSPGGARQPRSLRHSLWEAGRMPGMVETKDLAQLRQLNLELLRQLWAGQDAMRRSVAKAAAESNLDSNSSHGSEMPLSQERSSVAPRASYPQDASQRDPCNMSSPGGASSGVISLPPAKCQHQESLSPRRPCLAPQGPPSDLNDPERSAELEAQAPRSIPDQHSRLPERRVTCNREPPVPEKSWRLRPYLGYDWIAGSLDNSSPISSKPEDFFSKLQEFREANKEECIHSDPAPQLLGRCKGTGAEEDHECVYCYRVNRRLFLVPSDPGTPCHLCRTPRDQRGPETLAEPAQVRVSIPLSILDPPHQYRIHRRKSFDASDTLALPRHCLLGWDILPPKSERSSAPKNLDLWSCVASKAQHWKPSAGTSQLA